MRRTQCAKQKAFHSWNVTILCFAISFHGTFLGTKRLKMVGKPLKNMLERWNGWNLNKGPFLAPLFRRSVP